MKDMLLSEGNEGLSVPLAMVLGEWHDSFQFLSLDGWGCHLLSERKQEEGQPLSFAILSLRLK